MAALNPRCSSFMEPCRSFAFSRAIFENGSGCQRGKTKVEAMHSSDDCSETADLRALPNMAGSAT